MQEAKAAKQKCKKQTEDIKQSDRIKATHNRDNSIGNCFKLFCYQEGNVLRKNDKTKARFKTPKENDIKRFQVKEWVKFYYVWANRIEHEGDQDDFIILKLALNANQMSLYPCALNNIKSKYIK